MKTQIDLLYLRPGEISNEALAAMIGESKMADLKRRFDHPDIRCFVIAHEGVSEGATKSGNAVWTEYLKQTIREVYRAIADGIPAFFRHAANPQHDRQPIGEVVGKQLKEDVDGQMYTVAAICIYPEWASLNLDVASMEAELVVDVDQYGNAKVAKIEDVNGVALSTSAIDQPGFANARLVASFQYFQNKKDDSMTLEEVKNWIKENAARVTDIFPITDIVRDPEVTKEIDARLQTKHEHARRLETKIADLEKGASEEKSTLLEQVKEYQKKLVSANAAGAITASLAEITDDKMRAVVKKKLDEAIPKVIADLDDPEKVAEVVKAHQAAILADIEEIKGIVTPAPEKTPPAPERKHRDGNAPGLQKPDTVINDNPLIPAHMNI
jgi:hypothetical protein